MQKLGFALKSEIAKKLLPVSGKSKVAGASLESLFLARYVFAIVNLSQRNFIYISNLLRGIPFTAGELLACRGAAESLLGGNWPPEGRYGHWV